MRAAGVRLLAVVAVGLVWLAAAGVAFAHAEVRASEPPDLCLVPRTSRDWTPSPTCDEGVVLDQPPSTVRVTFSESVEPIAGGLRVQGPDGRSVTHGETRVEGTSLAVDVDAAASGSYLVSWRVVSQDTHPALGSYVFSVGQTSPIPEAGSAPELGSVTPLGLGLQVASRVLHFVGFALSLGVLLCQWLAAPTKAPLGAPRLVGLGLVCLLVAEPIALLGQSASLGIGSLLDPDTLADILASSTFGRVLALRLAVAVLLWVLLGSARTAPGWLGGGVVVLAAALALIDGQASHAVGAQPPWLAFLANAAHLLAMATWLGALLVVLARRASAAELARLAGLALAVLVASGLLLALQHLDGPADLVQTAYGQALLVKLVVLVAVLGLALGAGRSRVALARRLRLAEAGGLTAIVTLAGVLVSLPPPR